MSIQEQEEEALAELSGLVICRNNTAYRRNGTICDQPGCLKVCGACCSGYHVDCENKASFSFTDAYCSCGLCRFEKLGVRI